MNNQDYEEKLAEHFQENIEAIIITIPIYTIYIFINVGVSTYWYEFSKSISLYIYGMCYYAIQKTRTDSFLIYYDERAIFIRS